MKGNNFIIFEDGFLEKWPLENTLNLDFSQFQGLPYSHKRNEEGRVRESDVKDQNQMEESLAHPDSLQWEEEKVFPSSRNEGG